MKIEIRDLRNGDWYWIHKTVLEKYASKIGAYGIAIYNSLCYFTNHENQSSFPSYKKISEYANGGGTCDIQLLQKYHMMIEPKKSYPALTGLTFHGSSISAVSINKDEKDSFLNNE